MIAPAATSQDHADCARHDDILTPTADASGPARPLEVAVAVAKGKSAAQYARAHKRLTLVQTYQRLIVAGKSKPEAVAMMKAAGLAGSRTRYDEWLARFEQHGFAGLVDNSERAGRPRKLDLTNGEMAALKAARLTTNRTEHDGSTPEAVRLAGRRGQIRPAILATLMERERGGRMVPRSVHADLVAGPAVTKQHRHPTDASLDFLNAPGATMWVTDARTGAERFIQAGDILEADDATVNFPVCVPWQIGGDPCSERYGVRVARFQWLVAIDAATRFIPGWSYTMRPRSSYRAEDISALFHGLFRQHGVWSRLRLERGHWEAKQVTSMMDQLHIERMTAYSPHQKPYIEGFFSLAWSKMSDMPGQVGRYRGEEEETNKVLTSCQRGATDPTQHFPMLADALEAFRRATAERNAQPVKSAQWGTWVPEERWLAQQAAARQAGRLRELPAEAAWLFAPAMREWTVAGNTVGGSIQIMEGLSVRYDFAAEWLTNFVGSKVRVHFDPAAPRCEATIVLAQPVRSHRAGEVLGVATQVNKTARYAREVMGWAPEGGEADRGITERRQAAAALRREVRTVKAGGAMGHSVTEARDGLGNSLTIVSGGAPTDAGRAMESEAESGGAPQADAPRDITPRAQRERAALTPPASRRGQDILRTASPDEATKAAQLRQRMLAATRMTSSPVDAELVAD